MDIYEARVAAGKVRACGFLTDIVATRQDGEVLPSAYIVRVTEKAGPLAESWITDLYEEADVDSFQKAYDGDNT